jgi:hypothetical protein
VRNQSKVENNLQITIFLNSRYLDGNYIILKTICYFRVYIKNHNMGAEDLELIKSAISNARNLLYDEVESVCVDELSDEYNSVIKDLEDALKIIENEIRLSLLD